MSDADWIEKAARQIIDDAATVSPHNVKYHVESATNIIRQAYAAHIATLTPASLRRPHCHVDPGKLAERIEDIYINKLCQLPVGTPWEKARKEVTELLAPLLARNAAMEAVLSHGQKFGWHGVNESTTIEHLRWLTNYPGDPEVWEVYHGKDNSRDTWRFASFDDAHRYCIERGFITAKGAGQ